MSKPKKPNPKKGLVPFSQDRFGPLVQVYRRSSDNSIIREESLPDYYVSTLDVSKDPVVVGDRKKPNNWHYRIWDKMYLQGRFTQDYGSFYVEGSGAIYHPTYINADIPLPAMDRPDLYNLALDRLNELTRGSLDISIDLFQARQTVRMTRALKRAEDFYIDFAKKHHVKYQQQRIIANAWLEFVYGWKPLVQDIYDIADESLRFVVNKIQNYKSSAKENIPTLVHDLPVTSGAHLKYTVKYNGKVGYRFKLEMAVPDFDAARWSSLNPVSIVWELMPYSFVVDWFYDVGGSLRSMETALLYGQRFVSGYYTNLLAFDAKGDGVSPTSGKNWALGTSSFRYREFRRKVLIEYPFPRMPSLKAHLGASRLLSAAALLTGFLPKK